MKEQYKKWSREIRIEFAAALGIFLVVSFLIISNDIFEKWFAFSRANEDWQLDEALGVLIAALAAGTILAFRHLFLLRRLAKQLAEANEIIARQAEIKSKRDKLVALGELSSGLAHEINNALQPAIGLGGFIREGLIRSGNVKHLAFMETILNSAQHAQHVIENILVFTQDRSPDLQPFPAAEIVNEAVQFGRDLLPTTILFEMIGFDPQHNPDGKDLWIEANKTSLCQIFLNLFKNAAKAMNNAGKLKVTYKENQKFPSTGTPSILVEIEDIGCGIDQDVINRIFDPFFTTSDISEGTGLGLSVVHGLVQQHKGIITVNSSKGNGTTFSIHFPIISPPQ